jgi:HSF-type DNA-binding
MSKRAASNDTDGRPERQGRLLEVDQPAGQSTAAAAELRESSNRESSGVTTTATTPQLDAIQSLLRLSRHINQLSTITALPPTQASNEERAPSFPAVASNVLRPIVPMGADVASSSLESFRRVLENANILSTLSPLMLRALSPMILLSLQQAFETQAQLALTLRQVETLERIQALVVLGSQAALPPSTTEHYAMTMQQPTIELQQVQQAALFLSDLLVPHQQPFDWAAVSRHADEAMAGDPSIFDPPSSQSVARDTQDDRSLNRKPPPLAPGIDATINHPGVSVAAQAVASREATAYATTPLLGKNDEQRLHDNVERTEPFPEKLYRLLTEVEAAGKSDIISFMPSGLCFSIHEPATFLLEIAPNYFNHTNIGSLKRQLQIYNFRRVMEGGNVDCFRHKDFQRGRPELLCRIHRIPRRRKSSKQPKVPR